MIKSRGKEDKRGLSEVVTNLLLILLVLIAVGVVWVVVRNLLSSGSEQVEFGQFTFNLQIQSAYVSGTNVVVSVRRSVGGGDLTGVKFLFLGGGDTMAIDKLGALRELEGKTFTFTAAEIPGIGIGDEVSVAPIYESGGQRTGQITDSAVISGAPPGGGGGDTGEIGANETGSCGDNIIQIPNADGIEEECDNANLNHQTCESLLLGEGTLSCQARGTDGECRFDISQCAGAPVSCNGVWNATSEDPGVVCDGGANCLVNCVCSIGYIPDDSGGCIIEPSISTGTIDSVWPIGAVKYFDSDDLPKDTATMQSYIGKYANFSGAGGEPGCLQISYAEYLEGPGYNKSYVRVELVSTITAGDTLSIVFSCDSSYNLELYIDATSEDTDVVDELYAADKEVNIGRHGNLGGNYIDMVSANHIFYQGATWIDDATKRQDAATMLHRYMSR